jgi:hypothetical protein
MLLSSTETLMVEAAAVVIIAGILLGLADTPAYPIALGILFVALFAVLLESGASKLNPTGFFNWLGNPTGGT